MYYLVVRETRRSRRSRAKARREATRCSRRPRKVVNRDRQSRLESISLYRSVDERKLTKFYPSRPTVTDTRVDNEEKRTASRGSRMARTSMSRRPRRSYLTTRSTGRVRLSARVFSARGVHTYNRSTVPRSFRASTDHITSARRSDHVPRLDEALGRRR